MKKKIKERKKKLMKPVERVFVPETGLVLKDVEALKNLEGFFVPSTGSGEMVEIISEALLTSDDARFLKYMEKIKNVFLTPLDISINSIYQLLIVCHPDFSAHVYTNDIQIEYWNKAGEEINPGEKKTGLIRELYGINFPEIAINPEDKLFFCFKENWKFGLFFYIDPFNILDFDWVSSRIAFLFRRMKLDNIYETNETNLEFMKMMIDGWFPFVELIGEEFDHLISLYKDPHNFNGKMNHFLSRFDKTRIDIISFKWWENPVFADKQELIEEGIGHYLRGTSEGYLNCLSILFSQIEEVIKAQYARESGKTGNISMSYLLTYLIERGKTKIGHKDSLYIPDYYYRYLKEIVFAVFKFEKDNLKVSDIVPTNMDIEPETFLKIRALETFLILDQIYFYLL
ncbi:MAG TPA: hypothetical protein ENN73_06280 [Firmicutes bacterium]|nr:hypothetical protein [Bacillota bacterium]